MLDTSSQFIGDLLITEEDLRRQLEGLNKNKSAETDDIHPAIIKPLAGITAGPVCKLFQAGLEQGEIPKDWSGAAVAAIHKVSFMENLRVVSLSSILSTVMEKLTRVNMSQYLAGLFMLCLGQRGWTSWVKSLGDCMRVSGLRYVISTLARRLIQ